jgi:hypothetical protein
MSGVLEIDETNAQMTEEKMNVHLYAILGAGEVMDTVSCSKWWSGIRYSFYDTNH